MKSSLSNKQQTTISRRLSGIIAGGSLGEECTRTIDLFIRPRLKRIIEHEIKYDIGNLRARLIKLIQSLNMVDCLPLAIIHEDINAMNVIINDANEFAGLIDWEAASLLPLGINLWAIRRLAFKNIRGKEYKTDYTDSMARAWWDGFLQNVPATLGQQSRFVPVLVIIMQIGMVMSIFWEGHGDIDQGTLEQLCEQLTWLEKTYKPTSLQ